MQAVLDGAAGLECPVLGPNLITLSRTPAKHSNELATTKTPFLLPHSPPVERGELHPVALPAGLAVVGGEVAQAHVLAAAIGRGQLDGHVGL